MIAFVAFTVGAHPLILPSSVANTNADGPETPFSDTTNPEVGLAINPAGEPIGPNGWLGAGGIVTTSGVILPNWSYSVDTPVMLSATQYGLPGKNAIPHPLIRFGSL